MDGAPVLDQREHVTAVDLVLNAAIAPSKVWDYGTVPGSDGNKGQLPDLFALRTVERRYAEATHAARASRSGWRLTLRYVGRDVAEARWLEFKLSESLRGRRFVIDGVRSTPVTHDVSAPIRKDSDGRFSGETSWIYVL